MNKEKAEELLEYLKLYISYYDKSQKACEIRQSMPPKTSRAKITSANAKWARVAELRDDYEQEIINFIKSYRIDLLNKLL